MTAQQRPSLVVVARCADGPAAVVSDVVTCQTCGEACWISHETGRDTIAAARAIGDYALITCTMCSAERTGYNGTPS